MKLVSIIVPIYNVELYIRECLDSLVNQTYTAIEIIAVDDGSKDASGSIADEYASKYSNVHVIHKKNGGLSSARNAGLEIAKGEYIAFIDSDDLVSLDYVDLMVNALEQGYDYAECYNMAFDGEGNQWSYEYQSKSEISTINFKENPNELIKVAMFVRGNMYSRDFIKGLEFPEGLVHEDVYYTSILFHDLKRVCKVEGATYYYLIRNNSIANHASVKMFDMYEIMNRVVDYYESKNWEISNIITKSYVRTFLIAILFRKATHLSSEHFSLREEIRNKAIRTLNTKHSKWLFNSLITPKEKLATLMLHSRFVMNIIWKGAKNHE